MYKKSDFKCVDGFYYIGDVLDVDGNPWVEEEQLELIIIELNNDWEDLGPEYDSAGFTEEDRIMNGQYRNIQH